MCVGCLPQGAVISPSDEDSQTFSISGANSEVFRLKGKEYYMQVINQYIHTYIIYKMHISY